MLGNNEQKLISCSWLGEFPLLKAASRIARSCGKCGHRNVNPYSALQVAVERYAKDPAFIAKCKEVFGLPVSICGTLIQ